MTIRNIEPIYFECHITIEPVEGERLTRFQEICSKYKFKVANLLMRKTLEKSKLDSFCTGKDKNFTNMKFRMNNLLNELKNNNFNIYRYKIEAILLDSKIK